MKLILLRHGESLWNLENRFTGWQDVSLTSTGALEASFAGEQLLKENAKIISIYTSLLDRAIETAKIVSDIIDFPKEKIILDWHLNERHYGSLQGLNKSETAKKYGEERVHSWRRSFNIRPPLLSRDDKRHPRFNKKFYKIDGALPLGESLKDVIDRLKPFWNQYLEEIKEKPGDHLIVAHSNSLRAIIKILDDLSDEEIISVNIPTGVPLVYKFDNNLKITEKKYLIDDKKLKEKQEIIANQGKIQ